MTCVSRRRAATLNGVFTFSVLTLVITNFTGCVAPTTRIRLRELRPSSTAPQLAPPVASGVATAPTPSTDSTPSALTRVHRLKLEVVPQLQVPSPWQVHFGPDCAAATLANSGNAVEVLGDFVVEGYELRLKLDAAISRAIPERQVERGTLNLGQLMDAWSSLATGKHRLAVFAVRATDGQVPLDVKGTPAVAFCDFEVGPGGKTSSFEGPVTLSLLGPEGTLHGQSTRPLVQAFWVRGSRMRPTPDSNEALLMVGLPDGQQEAVGLGSGAYRLLPTSNEASLMGGDYALWIDTASRSRNGVSADPSLVSVITVNPE